jgi:hypothetical protein
MPTRGWAVMMAKNWFVVIRGIGLISKIRMIIPSTTANPK